MPIKINNKIYERIQYSQESDFEKDIVDNSDDIFGDKTIYVDIKKKVKGRNFGVIPDGYLIDLTVPGDPKMFVVENEIVSHDPFKHIGIQLIKFATSFDDDRVDIRNSIMEHIHSSDKSKRRLEEGCKGSEFRNIDQYLDKAVYGEFRALVVIDEASDALYRVLQKINADISVMEFNSYKSVDGDYAYEFDTLYEADIEPVGISTNQELTNDARRKRQNRRALCDTIIVPARQEGFEKEFIGNNRWYAIRIGAAMKNRIKYLATYQVSPVSSVTHIDEIQEIKPWEDTGKYVVLLKGDPKEIGPIRFEVPNKSLRSSVYAKKEDLLRVKTLDEALKY